MSATITVPGFTLTGVAGFGTDGAVHRGIDAEGRAVAIRLLPEAPAGLLARARAAAQVHHPGVATVRELRESTAGLAVVQDFIEGPTMSTLRAARRGLQAAECAQLALGLLAALEGLHAAGIIHGDVSPANVIVMPTADGAGRPVLVDLVGGPGPDRGTRGFRAPEVEAGAALGTAADVYSAAQLSLWAAAPDARAEVAARLAPLLSRDPGERPSAQGAQQMLDGGAQVAIALAPAEVLASATLREHAARELTTRARSRRSRPRRRHRAIGRRRWLLRGAAVAVVLTLVTGALLWLGPAASPGEGPPKAGPESVAASSAARAAQAAAQGAAGAGGEGSGEGAAGSTSEAAEQEPTETAGEAGGEAATEVTGDASTDTDTDIDTDIDTGLGTAVRNLLATRDAALTARDAVALAEVTVPGSPLAAADAALLADLTGAGLQLRGYRTEVLDLTVLSDEAGTAAVRAEIHQPAHQRVDSEGIVLPVPEQPSQCVRLDLERADAEAPWQATAATAC